jgi:hypothetical protein
MFGDESEGGGNLEHLSAVLRECERPVRPFLNQRSRAEPFQLPEGFSCSYAQSPGNLLHPEVPLLKFMQDAEPVSARQFKEQPLQSFLATQVLAAALFFASLLTL